MQVLHTLDRRRELADFLRGRRTRLLPQAVGLARGRRRRTPGLRREELAQLAGLSVDWYVRLEQGRDVQPSRETLEALAAALRLDEDERGHLFFLARAEPAPRPRSRAEVVDPPLLHAVQLIAAPAQVVGRRFDLLAWNDRLARLVIDFATVPVERRNSVWLVFTDPRVRARYADLPRVEREVVATLRGACAENAGDPDFEELVSALLDRSARFRELWALHDVRTKTSGTKVFNGPDGPLPFEWHTLESPLRSQQRLVYYVPKDLGACPPNGGRSQRSPPTPTPPSDSRLAGSPRARPLAASGRR